MTVAHLRSHRDMYGPPSRPPSSEPHDRLVPSSVRRVSRAAHFPARRPVHEQQRGPQRAHAVRAPAASIPADQVHSTRRARVDARKRDRLLDHHPRSSACALARAAECRSRQSYECGTSADSARPSNDSCSRGRNLGKPGSRGDSIVEPCTSPASSGRQRVPLLGRPHDQTACTASTPAHPDSSRRLVTACDSATTRASALFTITLSV